MTISVSHITDKILGWLTVANRRGAAVYTEADSDSFHLFTATAGTTQLKTCLDQYMDVYSLKSSFKYGTGPDDFPSVFFYLT